MRNLLLACALLLLLSGCNTYVALLSAAGLAKEPPEPELSISSRTPTPRPDAGFSDPPEAPRDDPDFFQSLPPWDFGEDPKPKPDFDSESDPEQEVDPFRTEGTVYYNGYLGLRVNIPAEYTGDDFRYDFYSPDPAALTEDPAQSQSSNAYDWWATEDGEGRYTTIAMFEFYNQNYEEYGNFAISIEDYPGLTAAEYFEQKAAWFQTGDAYDHYELLGQEQITINGVGYEHFTVRYYQKGYEQYARLEDYYLTSVQGMYIALYCYASEPIGEAAEEIDRLLHTVCEYEAPAGEWSPPLV